MTAMNPVSMLAQQRRRHLEFPLTSIRDVSKQYGRSVRTLRRWQAAGLMPPRVKHGRRLMYDKAAIEEMMEKRTRCKSL